jgi:hypothetical protein
MSPTKRIRSTAVQVVRWAGRAIGSLVAGFWLVVGAAGAIVGTDPWTWESTVMAVLVVGSVLSVAAAWRWEGVGGGLVLLFGVAHGVFAYVTAGHNTGLAMMMAGGPLVVAGLFFLASWWGRRAIHE